MSEHNGVVNNGAALLKLSAIDLFIDRRHILQNISLQLNQGETLTLIGLNGSGKSTLLRVIVGLIKADNGSVWLRPGIRIGYMPQRLVIEETLPLTVRRFMTLGRRVTREQVKTALVETGVEEVLDSPIQRISGGELQRVMLARALLRDPDLLVLDEPVQAVDVAGQYALYDLLGQIRQRRGCGILMASHDLHLVMPTTDRVICLNHHVCCAGPPETVSRHPAYLELFGAERAHHVAVYQHHHDHRHDPHGAVVSTDVSSRL